MSAPSTRPRPALIASLAAAVLLAGMETWLILRAREAATRAGRLLQAAQQELATLCAISPPPTEATAAAIDGEFREASASLVEWRARLGGGPEARRLREEAGPTRPADAYFDLAAFARDLRRQARAAHVALGNNERFGFAAYARGGPAAEDLAAVFRQRQTLDYLLRQLFAAGPERLLEVVRGPESRRSDAPASARQASPADDALVLPAGRSVAVPGLVAANAYRIAFAGGTGTLRRWLTAVASVELPLVVRLVEVEPYEKGNQPTTEAVSASTRASEDGPWVGRGTQKFTVILECIEAIDQSAGGDA